MEETNLCDSDENKFEIENMWRKYCQQRHKNEIPSIPL